MTQFKFTVVGAPGPQGSKKFAGFTKTNRPIIRESSPEKVKSWRDAVVSAALTASGPGHLPLFAEGVPVRLEVLFLHRRPKNHRRTIRGRSTGPLKEDAPQYVTVRPDLSKLVRSTEDAISDAGIWNDDNQVVWLSVAQVYSDGLDNFQGAKITITELHHRDYGKEDDHGS